MTDKINTTLTDIFKTTYAGDTERAIGNAFYGVNHRKTPTAVPSNKDDYGLTFFTRPQLNMSTPNLRAERDFIPMLTLERSSIQSIIRNYLDPRLSYKDTQYRCPLVDPENAFMPLLTNHLISCSGWPDPVTETFMSKPGAYKEVYGMTDSIIDLYGQFDLTATFRNMVADPITALFYTWAKYQSCVFKGTLVPYPDFMVANEVDYQTRIYRLSMDNTKRFVQKISCTGAAWPISVPLGSAFNFDSTQPLNDSNSSISINFRCIGACYQDPIIAYEFNEIVWTFNPSMADDKRDTIMRLLDYTELPFFNNRGYPRIDEDTMELQWYVTKEMYNRVAASYIRNQTAIA